MPMRLPPKLPTKPEDRTPISLDALGATRPQFRYEGAFTRTFWLEAFKNKLKIPLLAKSYPGRPSDLSVEKVSKIVFGRVDKFIKRDRAVPERYHGVINHKTYCEMEASFGLALYTFLPLTPWYWDHAALLEDLILQATHEDKLGTLVDLILRPWLLGRRGIWRGQEPLDVLHFTLLVGFCCGGIQGYDPSDINPEQFSEVVDGRIVLSTSSGGGKSRIMLDTYIDAFARGLHFLDNLELRDPDLGSDLNPTAFGPLFHTVATNRIGSFENTSDPASGSNQELRKLHPPYRRLKRPSAASYLVNRQSINASSAEALFDIDCQHLGWAVIDSGIDISHPAFFDWDKILDAGYRQRPAEREQLARQLNDDETFAATKLKHAMDRDGSDRPEDYSRIVAQFDLSRLHWNSASDQNAASADRHNSQTSENENEDNKTINEQVLSLSAEATERMCRFTPSELLVLTSSDPRGSLPYWLRVLNEEDENGSVASRLDANDPMSLLVAARAHFLAPRGQNGELNSENLNKFDPVHGTNVAGILASDWPFREGVARNLKLWDFKVCDGRPDRALESNVINACRMIMSINSMAGRKLIAGANLSLGFRYDVRSEHCGNTEVCEAVDELMNSGVFVSCAAGNQGHSIIDPGPGEKKYEFFPLVSIQDPGNARLPVTVGSVNGAEPHVLGPSYFSSRGPTADGRQKPDLLAPGEDIWGPALNQRFDTISGTSQAAPHVAGVAALMMARFPELVGNPLEIKRILIDTATDLGRDRWLQGAGKVDALRALQLI